MAGQLWHHTWPHSENRLGDETAFNAAMSALSLKRHLIVFTAGLRIAGIETTNGGFATGGVECVEKEKFSVLFAYGRNANLGSAGILEDGSIPSAKLGAG